LNRADTEGTAKGRGLGEEGGLRRRGSSAKGA